MCPRCGSKDLAAIKDNAETKTREFKLAEEGTKKEYDVQYMTVNNWVRIIVKEKDRLVVKNGVESTSHLMYVVYKILEDLGFDVDVHYGDIIEIIYEGYIILSVENERIWNVHHAASKLEECLEICLEYIKMTETIKEKGLQRKYVFWIPE